MTILFLDQFSELGGAQQTLVDTVEAVRNAGWGPRVLLPGNGPLVELLHSRDVVTREIPCGPYQSGSKTFADSIQFMTNLRQQVRIIRDEIARGDAELVYVNGPRLLAAAILATPKHVPLVFHIHSHLRGAALRLTRWFLRWRNAIIIGCSNSVLEAFRNGGVAAKFHVIANGVPDAGYRDRHFDFGSKVRIGMIGRIAPEKGQMEFVDAVALLKDEIPQAQFVICGAPLFHANSSYFKVVRLRARGLPIRFIDWQENVSSVLAELDLLAVPSLQEGMGRIVVEALSAGVPVVAFPAGGIPEIVRDGVTGLLSSEPSGAALATRIRDVLAMDPENLRQVVRNARWEWSQSYTKKVYQQRITNLLESAAIARAARAIEMPQQLI